MKNTKKKVSWVTAGWLALAAWFRLTGRND